jgi:hypothetical protein
MHIVREYLTALFGWHVMQRQCYVEKQSLMKNYEEFRGQQFKLEFDVKGNIFNYVPLQGSSQLKSAETILFKPKSNLTEKITANTKVRRTA